MGGFGSGRYERRSEETPATVEDYCRDFHRLDVRRLHRCGYLIAGAQLPREVFSAASHDPHLTGWVTEEGIAIARGSRPAHQTIPLEWTPCRYGGQRPWFLCPAQDGEAPCRRRVALLYWDGEGYRCRACAELVYESPRLSPRARALHKGYRLRVQLGSGFTTALDPLPGRPPGMHRRTYQRRVEALAQAEAFGLGEHTRHTLQAAAAVDRFIEEAGSRCPRELQQVATKKEGPPSELTAVNAKKGAPFRPVP